MSTRRVFLRTSAVAAAYLASWNLACSRRQRAWRHRIPRSRSGRPRRTAGPPPPTACSAGRNSLIRDDQRAGRHQRPQGHADLPRRRPLPAEDGGADPEAHRARGAFSLIFGTMGTPTKRRSDSISRQEGSAMVFFGAGARGSTIRDVFPGPSASYVHLGRSGGASTPSTFSRPSPARRSACCIRTTTRAGDFSRRGEGRSRRRSRRDDPQGSSPMRRSDPTVNSQIFTLQGAGVDTLLIGALAKQKRHRRSQGVRIGGRRKRYLFHPLEFDPRGAEGGGLDGSKGIITNYLARTRADRVGRTMPATRRTPPSSRKYMTPAEVVGTPP